MFDRDAGRRRVVVTLRIATAYFLMMEPRVPAWDTQTGKASYESSYRFASSELMGATPTRFTMVVPTSSWLNRLFWPADCVVHPLLEPYHRHMLDRYRKRNEHG